MTMEFLNSLGLNPIDVQKLDENDLVKTYLLLQFYMNYLNRKSNPENENTTTNAGVRLPDVKRKNEELEEALSKNFDELNKISRNMRRVRLPDVKRKNEELEEALSKNFDELNKISRNMRQEVDEKELEKAESFFQKKKALEELKADPSLHQLSAPNAETLRGEYMQCLEDDGGGKMTENGIFSKEELTKVNEELNREQKRAVELKELLERMKSGDRDH
uniref:Uncharacterized protein n=1 Tax=Ascaris lumbricoides TaxID=6252 RepID=A0A0M3ITG6_ASCLU